MRVVIGVGGGIAAYKVPSLLRLFTEAGHEVTVVPTAASLRFVGTATWEALSGRPAPTEVWSDVPRVPHVRLGQDADLVVVAPATADLLARAAHGHADDLLTSTLLTARCPVVLAPAMHTEMWEHPATRANVEVLRSRGVHVVEPASGRLTGADTGAGRLPEPADLHAACLAVIDAGARSLAGRRVVVSAGGTREPLDPVRFLGNRSSGKQGYALAEVAARRGAQVTLVAANTALPAPAGVDVVPVETAEQLGDAVTAAAADADVVVMAAAVADFRPRQSSVTKIKKTHGVDDAEQGQVVELVRTRDVLAGLVADRAGGAGGAGGADRAEPASPVIVGFAAETGDDTGSVLDLGRAKLARKGCDLLVVNEVGTEKTFGRDDTTVHVLTRGSDDVVDLGPDTKRAVSAGVWDAIERLL